MGLHASVSGIIEHAGGSSKITIKHFSNPLRIAPSVNCQKAWIRRSPSWHYEIHNHRFCWVLSEEWQEHFKKRLERDEPVGILCDDAVTWLIQAMRIVLTRHWIGHNHGIFEWPKEWEDYSHGEKGLKEFRAGKFSIDDRTD